jgi:hypothetical protein
MGYTQNSNPFSRKISPLSKSYKQAYADRDMDTYGNLDLKDYTTEAKRQAGLYKESGGTIKDGIATGGTWDVPTIESLKETYPKQAPDIKPVVDTSPAVELTGRQKRAKKKVERIEGRIKKRGGKGARAGQAGRLAKAKAKMEGLSGKEARDAGKKARKN